MERQNGHDVEELMTRKAQRAQRAQFGGGIAAGILSLLGLAVLLFAPLVPACVADVSFTPTCPPHALRYVALPQTHLGGDVWALILGMLIILLAGAAAALADARFAWRLGAIPLWAAVVLALGGWGYAARSVVGLVYLPAVLALCLATYASILRLPPRPARPRLPTAAPSPDDKTPS
ncbi:MAG: hypothetical protein IVW57_06465 [Ktedonobacterales bacterium]|nr:hypothetical protein [Ktedonobacterales bacterium]